MRTSRAARLVAAAGAALALCTAPVAAADPEDNVPVCSGAASPELDNCRTSCPGGASIDQSTDECDQQGYTPPSAPLDEMPTHVYEDDPYQG